MAKLRTCFEEWAVQLMLAGSDRIEQDEIVDRWLEYASSGPYDGGQAYDELDPEQMGRRTREARFPVVVRQVKFAN